MIMWTGRDNIKNPTQKSEKLHLCLTLHTNLDTVKTINSGKFNKQIKRTIIDFHIDNNHVIYRRYNLLNISKQTKTNFTQKYNSFIKM